MIEILAVIAFFFLQTAIHEGMHVVIPLWKGFDVTYRPWPQFVDRQFYFGYTSWLGWQMKSHEKFLTYMLPRIADVVIVTSIFMVQFFVDVPKCVALWCVCAAVDYSVNTFGSFTKNEHNDAHMCVKVYPEHEYWIVKSTVLTMMFVIGAALAVVFRISV